MIMTNTASVADNEIKIKFMGEQTFIGKEIIVKYIPIVGDAVIFNLPVVSL